MSIAQLTFDEPRAETRKPLTIQQRFEAFHAANPRVYAKLVELTRELKARGFIKVGIAMVFEVVRWEHAKEVGPITTTEGFTLNNVFRSRYARAIMSSEPDLRDIYELRELQSE